MTNALYDKRDEQPEREETSRGKATACERRESRGPGHDENGNRDYVNREIDAAAMNVLVARD